MNNGIANSIRLFDPYAVGPHGFFNSLGLTLVSASELLGVSAKRDDDLGPRLRIVAVPRGINLDVRSPGADGYIRSPVSQYKFQLSGSVVWKFDGVNSNGERLDEESEFSRERFRVPREHEFDSPRYITISGVFPGRATYGATVLILGQNDSRPLFEELVSTASMLREAGLAGKFCITVRKDFNFESSVRDFSYGYPGDLRNSYWIHASLWASLISTTPDDNRGYLWYNLWSGPTRVSHAPETRNLPGKWDAGGVTPACQVVKLEVTDAFFGRNATAQELIRIPREWPGDELAIFWASVRQQSFEDVNQTVERMVDRGLQRGAEASDVLALTVTIRDFQLGRIDEDEFWKRLVKILGGAVAAYLFLRSVSHVIGRFSRWRGRRVSRPYSDTRRVTVQSPGTGTFSQQMHMLPDEITAGNDLINSLGGNVVGPPGRNFPAIDGTFRGRPLQIKTTAPTAGINGGKNQVWRSVQKYRKGRGKPQVTTQFPGIHGQGLVTHIDARNVPHGDFDDWVSAIINDKYIAEYFDDGILDSITVFFDGLVYTIEPTGGRVTFDLPR